MVKAGRLDRQDAFVYFVRMGWDEDDGEQRTLRQTARMLNRSHEHVRQVVQRVESVLTK